MSSEHKNWLLWGGIGAGKSEARRLLAGHGLFTIDADSIGHQVLAPGGTGHEAVAAAWPEVVDNGEIDRSALGAIVFGDRDQLRRLEEITHPLIFSEISQIVADAEEVVIVEVPILGQPFDEPWGRMVVDASDAIRLERAMGRGLSRSDALDRMRAQPSRATWLGAADLVIPNSGSMDQLEISVQGILPTLVG